MRAVSYLTCFDSTSGFVVRQRRTQRDTDLAVLCPSVRLSVTHDHRTINAARQPADYFSAPEVLLNLQ